MKIKILYLALALFSIISCNSQKKNNSILNNKIMYPIITKDFEKFPNTIYENRKDKSSLTFREFSNGEYIEMIKTTDGANYYETPSNSYFQIFKEYYKNDNLKSKGLSFNVWGGFRKGIWYEFDEQGKLIKETNYDKFYKFTFEHILQFCKKENIEVQKGPILQSTGFHTIIKRRHSAITESSFWTIEWLKKPDIIEEITINGTTGEVLKRKDVNYINN